jgi:hypothetical protein
MKVGDLVRYQWHNAGQLKNHAEVQHKVAGVVLCTQGIMLCSFGLELDEEPYKMGTVEVMWQTDKIEKITYAELEVISEC